MISISKNLKNSEHLKWENKKCGRLYKELSKDII